MSFSKQKTRYGSKRVETDGYSFASKLEASVYQILKLRERAGELKILQTQDHVYLTRARIGYVPDFKCMCMKTGDAVWIEAKGFETPDWKIKKKLWKFYGPGRLEIFTGSYTNPKLTEIIEVVEEGKP